MTDGEHDVFTVIRGGRATQTARRDHATACYCGARGSATSEASKLDEQGQETMRGNRNFEDPKGMSSK